MIDERGLHLAGKGVRAAAACLLVLASAWVHAGEWSVREEGSVLGFETTYDTMTISGEFTRFDASIRFDASQLAESSFDVRVHMAGAQTGAEQGDRMLARPEWFDPQTFPQARFHAERIERDGDAGGYAAVGTLSIKSREQHLRFPFQWTVLTDGRAKLQGSAVVNRLDYDVGTGKWQADDSIGPQVRIVVLLELERS